MNSTHLATITKRTFGALALAGACTVLAAVAQQPELDDPRPNILLIVAEDMGQELSCYGNPNVKTPHLDALAESGVLFENAYCTQAVCSPSRSSIFTGLYPHQSGQLGLNNNYPMSGTFPTSYQLLKQAGYATGLIGKAHISPDGAVEDHVEFRQIRHSNFNKQALQSYTQHAANFIKSAKHKPFFLTVNFPDAHNPFQSQVGGRPRNPVSAANVSGLPYVGFHNGRIGGRAAGYYNCILRLDECVGELLDALEKSGRADKTLVIFISDHGAQFARGKIWPLEGGVKIPYMVRWPGVAPAGVRRPDLVSTIDLLPTFLDAAAEPARGELPGTSLVPVLTGSAAVDRTYLAVERNCDAPFLYFPQRAIRDQRYKLIWSPVRDRPDPAVLCYTGHAYTQYSGCPSNKELVNADESVKKLYAEWRNPPEYQLYDLNEDPWEFTNLAEQPEHVEVETRLKAALQDWMNATDDWICDPEKLARLTAEHDALPMPKKTAPAGGWKYHEYLRDK